MDDNKDHLRVFWTVWYLAISNRSFQTCRVWVFCGLDLLPTDAIRSVCEKFRGSMSLCCVICELPKQIFWSHCDAAWAGCYCGEVLLPCEGLIRW